MPSKNKKNKPISTELQSAHSEQSQSQTDSFRDFTDSQYEKTEKSVFSQQNPNEGRDSHDFSELLKKLQEKETQIENLKNQVELLGKKSEVQQKSANTTLLEKLQETKEKLNYLQDQNESLEEQNQELVNNNVSQHNLLQAELDQLKGENFNLQQINIQQQEDFNQRNEQNQNYIETLDKQLQIVKQKKQVNFLNQISMSKTHLFFFVCSIIQLFSVKFPSRVKLFFAMLAEMGKLYVINKQ